MPFIITGAAATIEVMAAQESKSKRPEGSALPHFRVQLAEQNGGSGWETIGSDVDCPVTATETPMSVVEDQRGRPLTKPPGTAHLEHRVTVLELPSFTFPEVIQRDITRISGRDPDIIRYSASSLYSMEETNDRGKEDAVTERFESAQLPRPVLQRTSSEIFQIRLGEPDGHYPKLSSSANGDEFKYDNEEYSTMLQQATLERDVSKALHEAQWPLKNQNKLSHTQRPANRATRDQTESVSNLTEQSPYPQSSRALPTPPSFYHNDAISST